MVKHLKFSKVMPVERRGALMLVWYLDEEGNMYDWAPKWSEVEEIFLKQINVERFNKPESEWLNKFAKTTEKVVEGAQRIESARKVLGTFERYSNGNLVIERGKYSSAFVKPGFEITTSFLDEWLGRDIEVFVVNDMAIRLKFSFYDIDDELHAEYYPPEEPSEELPF